MSKLDKVLMMSGLLGGVGVVGSLEGYAMRSWWCFRSCPKSFEVLKIKAPKVSRLGGIKVGISRSLQAESNQTRNGAYRQY